MTSRAGSDTGSYLRFQQGLIPSGYGPSRFRRLGVGYEVEACTYLRRASGETRQHTYLELDQRDHASVVVKAFQLNPPWEQRRGSRWISSWIAAELPADPLPHRSLSPLARPATRCLGSPSPLSLMGRSSSIPFRIGTEPLRQHQCSLPGASAKGLGGRSVCDQSCTAGHRAAGASGWCASSVLTQTGAPMMSSLASYQRSRARPAVWLIAVHHGFGVASVDLQQTVSITLRPSTARAFHHLLNGLSST